jgi:2-dehydropantoate 2-reductase
MKICIYGGGAIGGYIAAHLARAGTCDVSIVARNATFDAIAAKGVRIIKADEEFTARPRVVKEPSELGTQDFLFITLKIHQLSEALDQIKCLIGPETVIIPPSAGLPYYFMSGLRGPYEGARLPPIDPEGRQWATMPPSQVLGCPYWIGVHSPEPGTVVRDGARARLPMGELNGEITPRLQQLSAALEAAGIEAPLSSNIHGEVWVKFVNSLCWNPVAILTRARMGEIDDFPPVVSVARAMMDEADAIGRQFGVTIPIPPAERIAGTLRGKLHKMSMLQDFERQRPMELGSLYDSLISLNDLSRTTTPTLEAVYALARLREATAAGAPPN